MMPLLLSQRRAFEWQWIPELDQTEEVVKPAAVGLGVLVLLQLQARGDSGGVVVIRDRRGTGSCCSLKKEMSSSRE